MLFGSGEMFKEWRESCDVSARSAVAHEIRAITGLPIVPVAIEVKATEAFRDRSREYARIAFTLSDTRVSARKQILFVAE